MSGMLSAFEGPGYVLANIHKPLGQAEGIPLVGPAIVSPIHIVVSAVQLAVGLVFAILSAIAALFCLPCSREGTDFFAQKAGSFIMHAGCGLVGIGWSVANMISLGCLAYQVVGTPCQPKP
jgi:hypothetical protein